MKINNGFKKFVLKFLLVALPVCALYVSLCIYTDTFNVFHPYTIRATRAEPNKHFLKVNYLLSHPEKYNAFLFGSSHVGNIPVSYLKENSDLHWYNMTYSEGVPEEHFEDLKILIEGGVSIKKIIVGIDYISMYVPKEGHINQLIRKPYSEYIRLGKRFYLPYLTQFDFGILHDVLQGEYKTDSFFGDGGNIKETESFFPAEENVDHKSAAYPYIMPYNTAVKDIKAIRDFCNEHDIEVTFIANPIWKRTYIDVCKDNYLDFLYEVAQITPFINFSCLNEITTDGRNYYEGSHYRPNIGLLMLRILLNEDFEERESLASSQFGVWVTSDNVDSVISSLQTQLDSTLDTDIGN